MRSLGKQPPSSPRIVAFSVIGLVVAIALGVAGNGSAVAETDPPQTFADCILDNMRHINSDQAANLIAESCAEKFPTAASIGTKPLFADPDSDLPPGVDIFDGQWTWRARFPSDGSCFPTRIDIPMKIEYGILKGSIVLGNLGTNAVEGTVRPSGKAQFWGTSGHHLIQFEGRFSGDQGRGKMTAQSDNFACSGGSWVAVRSSSGQISGN